MILKKAISKVLQNCALNGLGRKRRINYEPFIVTFRFTKSYSVHFFFFTKWFISLFLCQPGRFCAIILTSVFVYFLFQALRGMASENDGHVTCPKTKETFRVDQADKVYVM